MAKSKYYKISKAIFKNLTTDKLSVNAFKITVLFDFKNGITTFKDNEDKRYFIYTIKEMIIDLHKDKKQVINAIKELEEKEYIKIVKAKSKTNSFKNLYYLNDKYFNGVYYRINKSLFNDLLLKKINITEFKILTLFTERHKISKLKDKNQDTYFIYSNSEIKDSLNLKASDKIVKSIKNLSEKGYILKLKSPIKNNRNKNIYYLFLDDTKEEKSELQPIEEKRINISIEDIKKKLFKKKNN